MNYQNNFTQNGEIGKVPNTQSKLQVMEHPASLVGFRTYLDLL